MYRIRDLREDRDLSQAEIAKVIKTTQQQYSKIETGDRKGRLHIETCLLNRDWNAPFIW